MKQVRTGLLGLLILLICGVAMPGGGGDVDAKIGGVSVVSPPSRVDNRWVDPVKHINADWVAVLPYAFSYVNNPRVSFNLDRQWWGERFEGMREIIRHAKQKGLKVMLKPMVWVSGSWPGDFQMGSEAKWKEWELEYAKYIASTARIAQQEGVDMFCVGTEFKIAARERERYWRALIDRVRSVYDGPVTYAANWDNFSRVPFWDKVDYIGVDAYFPLSERKTPSVNELKQKWAAPRRGLEHLHKVYDKPILFTEFGYRSIDACTWKQWELEKFRYTDRVNLQGQVNAYKAFFESFWKESWFAGVFLWQWYTNDQRAGGTGNSDYTVQNKPAEKLIADWFGK